MIPPETALTTSPGMYEMRATRGATQAIALLDLQLSSIQGRRSPTAQHEHQANVTASLGYHRTRLQVNDAIVEGKDRSSGKGRVTMV